MIKKSILVLLLIFPIFVGAQEKMEADTQAVRSIHGIVNELLRLISSEEGKTRNGEAIGNLFIPTARFTVLMHDSASSDTIETIGLEEFLEMMTDPYYDKDFYETELHKVVDEYNGIAQVFQTYHGYDGEGYSETGLNSYQLAYFDDRWWIVSTLWTGNSNGVDIPEKYLSPEK